MCDITRILADVSNNIPGSRDRLLELVTGELRRMAHEQMAREKPGHPLQTTDLLFDVYHRLMNGDSSHNWANRRHFFGAAAQAMRCILVDEARRNGAVRRGGRVNRITLDLDALVTSGPDDPARLDLVIDVDVALTALERENWDAACLVILRFFVGMTARQSAEVMEFSERKAYKLWNYARCWLLRHMRQE